VTVSKASLSETMVEVRVVCLVAVTRRRQRNPGHWAPGRLTNQQEHDGSSAGSGPNDIVEHPYNTGLTLNA
jgi:hypothetical protein